MTLRVVDILRLRNEWRQVLAEMGLVAEAPAAGMVALGGSSSKPGHKVLARFDVVPDGPAPAVGLRDVWQRRYWAAKGSLVRLEEELEAAKVALEEARVRQPYQRVEGDWRPVFLQATAGVHYVRAARLWGVSPVYVRKLRVRAGVRPLDGQEA